NATNIATNTTDIATNATNIADHIALDDDTDSGNEYNTAFAVNGANLEVTDEGGTLSVPLSSINTDDQTAAEVSYDNSSSSLTSTNVQDALDEAVSNGAAAIAANTTLINNHIADDDDIDPINEIQDLNLTGDILTITNNTGATDINLGGYLDNTDDQDASEVNIVTAVDVDGDSTNETTVEEAIQDMAPIVSKAARIFYPPSIAIDASVLGVDSINLYDQYIDQFGTPSVASAGAPAAIPTYAANELYYYVTYYDPAVFDNVSINASGVMTYEIIATPADYNSLINVVFVVQ